jgi:uncharacterized membrane protein YeaQ/YmgE (transglycosylase-associated protein family)
LKPLSGLANYSQINPSIWQNRGNKNDFIEKTSGEKHIFVTTHYFHLNPAGIAVPQGTACLPQNSTRMDILYILVIGAVAGWLAGLIWKGGGFGLLGNIILGIVGSFVGGWLLAKMGVAVKIGSPTMSLIVTSIIGAVVVLFVASLFRRR